MQYETADLRRMVVQLSRLVEISVTLNSTVDQEGLLRFIALSASDVLEAETAVILLVDPNTRALQAVASASASAGLGWRPSSTGDGNHHPAGRLDRRDCPARAAGDDPE